MLFSIILRIFFRNRKLTHFPQSCREMDSNSNNVVPPASAQVATLIMAQALVMPTIVPISVSPGDKLEKFNRLNFKRWLFYLTTLNLTRFLTENDPKFKVDERDIQVIGVVDAWKHSDYLCMNYVMNTLTDFLYNKYSYKKITKEL